MYTGYGDAERHDGDAEVRVLGETRPRSRVRRVCDCCGEPIEPGQRYARLVFLQDGEFRVSRTHGSGYPSCPCDVAAERAWAEADAAQQERDRADRPY